MELDGFLYDYCFIMSISFAFIFQHKQAQGKCLGIWRKMLLCCSLCILSFIICYFFPRDHKPYIHTTTKMLDFTTFSIFGFSIHEQFWHRHYVINIFKIVYKKYLRVLIPSSNVYHKLWSRPIDWINFNTTWKIFMV